MLLALELHGGGNHTGAGKAPCWGGRARAEKLRAGEGGLVSSPSPALELRTKGGHAEPTPKVTPGATPGSSSPELAPDRSRERGASKRGEEESIEGKEVFSRAVLV